MAGQTLTIPVVLVVALFAAMGFAGCITEAESPPLVFPSIQVDGVYTYDGQAYRVGADWDGIDRYLQNRTLVAFYPADTTDVAELENGTFLYDLETRDRFWRMMPLESMGAPWLDVGPFAILMQLSGRSLETPGEVGGTFLHDHPARLQIASLEPDPAEDAWRLDGVFHLGDGEQFEDERRFNATFAIDGSWFRVGWHNATEAHKIVRETDGTDPLPPPEIPQWPRFAEGVEATHVDFVDGDAGPCTPLLTVRDLVEHPLITSDFGEWFDAHPTAHLVDYKYDRGGTPLGRYNDRPDRHNLRITLADEDGEGYKIAGSQYTGKPGEPEMPITDLDWGPQEADPSPRPFRTISLGDLYCLNARWYGDDTLLTYVHWQYDQEGDIKAWFEIVVPDVPNHFAQYNACTGGLVSRTYGGDAIIFPEFFQAPCWQRITK